MSPYFSRFSFIVAGCMTTNMLLTLFLFTIIFWLFFITVAVVKTKSLPISFGL